jgi:hypothetical protein
MLGAKRFLVDRQRPLVERQRLIVMRTATVGLAVDEEDMR